MLVPGLTYGQAGPWALAVWVKPRLDDGTSFDYVLSHAATGASDFAFQPNEARRLLGGRLGLLHCLLPCCTVC